MTLRDALAEAATPGPWRVELDHGGDWAWVYAADHAVSGSIPADAALIVAMRNALPALLDVVDAARDYVREYERPAGRGRYISHEVDEAHLTGEPCRLCDALARYEEVSRG